MLARLHWILALVAVGGVGVAVVLGHLVTRTALAPVRRLTATAEEITATRRSRPARRRRVRKDELGRLGTSFNTMLAALEDSQLAQRRLVADASHELRTPLTSLRTNVELIARGDLPDGEREQALADVSPQLEELTALVDRRRRPRARRRARDRHRGRAARPARRATPSSAPAGTRRNPLRDAPPAIPRPRCRRTGSTGRSRTFSTTRRSGALRTRSSTSR